MHPFLIIFLPTLTLTQTPQPWHVRCPYHIDDEFDSGESSMFEYHVSQLSSHDPTMAWAVEQKSVLQHLVQEILSISKASTDAKPCARKTFTVLVRHLTRFPGRAEERSSVSPQGAATSLPVLLLLLRRPRWVDGGFVGGLPCDVG